MPRRDANNLTPSVAEPDERTPTEPYLMDPKLGVAKHSAGNAEGELEPEPPEEDEETEDDDWMEERCALLNEFNCETDY